MAQAARLHVVGGLLLAGGSSGAGKVAALVQSISSPKVWVAKRLGIDGFFELLEESGIGAVGCTKFDVCDLARPRHLKNTPRVDDGASWRGRKLRSQFGRGEHVGVGIFTPKPFEDALESAYLFRFVGKFLRRRQRCDTIEGIVDLSFNQRSPFPGLDGLAPSLARSLGRRPRRNIRSNGLGFLGLGGAGLGRGDVDAFRFWGAVPTHRGLEVAVW